MTDETRERIVDAAGEIFARKGFQQATIREICREAGANVAAVNYHFGDKERLYVEAVKRAHCESVPTKREEWPSDLPAEQQLRLFLEKMLIDMLDRDSPGWHIELIMREMAHPTTACEELVRGYIEPKFQLLCSIVRSLLPEDASNQQVHLHAFSIIGQCLLYRFHRPVGRLLIGDEEFESLFVVETLTQHIANVCLAGMQATFAGEPR